MRPDFSDLTINASVEEKPGPSENQDLEYS